MIILPFDLNKYLVIGISSRALFDLSLENKIYEEKGLKEYSKYQIEHENDILKQGAGFNLIKGFLHINEIVSTKRKSEVIILSRNNADTSLRIFNSIEKYNLDISRAALTSGESLTPYLNAFDVDLFLSADKEDVQEAINAGFAAGLIYENYTYAEDDLDQIRIAFDGDAVLFSDESEKIYQEKGLEAFLEHEKENAKKPLPEGPFAKLLKSLSFIQKQFDGEKSPIRTALVTSRNMPAHERVIRTLREWGIRIDEAFFLGGAPKGKVLDAFGAHIFFDDQIVHLDTAAKFVPVAQVPYKEEPGSIT